MINQKAEVTLQGEVSCNKHETFGNMTCQALTAFKAKVE